MTRTLAFLFCILLISSNTFASDIEMADTMRSNGMIYVVISVLSIVFVGIIIFLIMIERRLKKLENNQE
ncbi:MAG: CcmD family protein [Bacteroidia bacterium]|nr:CcmD family protein [Bacteroidia bacterium]